MKRFVLFLVAAVAAAQLYGQAQIPAYQAASGRWTRSGDRLYQEDVKAPLAKVNLTVPQTGAMIYEFNARYEGGAEDGHGGFGLHLFADKVHSGPSWGTGRSYLLWLNYDKKPQNSRIPAGLSAQVYKSVTHSRMDLIHSVSLKDYERYLTRDTLAAPVSFTIWMDGASGEVRVYDPINPKTYYQFFIDKKDLPLKGNYVALRTNGIALSFALEE